MERKRGRKRKNPEESACYTVVSQQTLDLILCPSKIESDITRIYAGRWGPSQSHGRKRKRESGVGVGGENKRIRGPVSEWEKERASRRKGEWETGRKKERETHHGAQENPALRKGERQRKNYGERESEGNWDRNDRDVHLLHATLRAPFDSQSRGLLSPTLTRLSASQLSTTYLYKSRHTYTIRLYVWLIQQSYYM